MFQGRDKSKRVGLEAGEKAENLKEACMAGVERVVGRRKGRWLR